MAAMFLLTAAFFGLTGLLWYHRPDPDIWLFGSLVLFSVWGVLFMQLITKERPK